MNWEETIQYIRTKPEYSDLVDQAYLNENLQLNVERFKISDEYKETIKLVNRFCSNAKTILDVGSGNGISAIAFALDGFKVTAVEPDPSLSVGAGAIRKLIEDYGLSNIEVFENHAEDIDYEMKQYDVIYVRQAMHHAYDLEKFIQNLVKHLKSGGLLMTVRDHVIFNEGDKQLFLETHPLQKFYGGENAFTLAHYMEAFEKADCNIELILRHFDSVINYFPLSMNEFEKADELHHEKLKTYLRSRIGFLGNLKILLFLYKLKIKRLKPPVFDEANMPGRMYSFIATKK